MEPASSGAGHEGSPNRLLPVGPMSGVLLLCLAPEGNANWQPPSGTLQFGMLESVLGGTMPRHQHRTEADQAAPSIPCLCPLRKRQ